MKSKKYNDLYELYELTESIYYIRQIMKILRVGSYEYQEVADMYNDLWKRRNALETKVMGIGEDSDEDNY